MINKTDKIAIVGASKNKEKYGHKVTDSLIKKGYDVIPVNPREKEILGQEVFIDLFLIKEKIDVVIFVVPPEITEEVLKQVKKLGIKKVWMQPGSESEKAIKFCEENKIECVHNSCIMIG